MQRRTVFCGEHGIKKLDTRLPFWGKVICCDCGAAFQRKTWVTSKEEKYRRVWMCKNRFQGKGVKGCYNRHVDEELLKEGFVEAFNALVENREHFLEKWRVELEGANELRKYRLGEFGRILESAVKLENFDEGLCLKLLEQIEIMNGTEKVVITLLDGTSMQCE